MDGVSDVKQRSTEPMTGGGAYVSRQHSIDSDQINTVASRAAKFEFQHRPLFNNSGGTSQL